MSDNRLDLTNATWDSNPDATLGDDSERPGCCFGAPLTRMVKFEYLSSSSTQSNDDLGDFEDSGYFVRDEEINLIEEDMSLFDLALTRHDEDGVDENPSLRSTTHAYVHHVIDHMSLRTQYASSPRLYMHATPSHPSYPLLIRHLPSTTTWSRELSLWRYLNDASLRRDPWNPSPPVLSIVERGRHSSDNSEDEAYIAMDRLYRVQDNPLTSTGDWIDFVRQMLQGLVFLHEHNVARVSYPLADSTNPPGIMMDIGLAPSQTHFSRTEYPVKYYLLDFSQAVRLRIRKLPQPTCCTRCFVWQGRSKSTVQLPASHPRIPTILSDSFIGSLIVDAPSVNLTFTLASARARSDPDMTLVSSGFNSLDPIGLSVDTPKQCHFFSQPSSPDRFSDPEMETGTEELSSDEEQECLTVVLPPTRALLFAADLKNLARMLEEVVQLAKPVSEALVPVFSAMRQAAKLPLSAEDALRLFENVVRQPDVTSVVL